MCEPGDTTRPSCLPSLRKLSPVFTLAVFGFAIYAITLELKRFSLAQISESFLAIEPWKLLVAACLVPPGLCALASYDLVAAGFFRLGIGRLKPLFTGLLAAASPTPPTRPWSEPCSGSGSIRDGGERGPGRRGRLLRGDHVLHRTLVRHLRRLDPRRAQLRTLLGSFPGSVHCSGVPDGTAVPAVLLGAIIAWFVLIS